MLLPGVKIEYTITDVKNPKSKIDSNKNKKNKKTVFITPKLSTNTNENLTPASNAGSNSKSYKIRFEEPQKKHIQHIVTNVISTLPEKQRMSPGCYSPRRKVDPNPKGPPTEGWNISTCVPNRDDLIREQDNIISKIKVKQNNWMGEEKETIFQTHDKRMIQKEKLRVVDARANRYPSKSFGGYVNNPYKAYPFLHDDPMMVALNHGKWDGGSDRYFDVPTRSLPEKPSKDHHTFAKQFRIKNEKRVDNIIVSHEISEIADIKSYY